MLLAHTHSVYAWQADADTTVVIPALSFGFGVAFLFFGRKLLSGDRPSALSRGSFVSIWWLLVNWWPHSNFHRVSSGWTNIVVIDYFFHTTVIVATCVMSGVASGPVDPH